MAKKELKYLNKVPTQQLKQAIEGETKWLEHYLSSLDRNKVSGYIKYLYKYINTCKLIIAKREIAQ